MKHKKLFTVISVIILLNLLYFTGSTIYFFLQHPDYQYDFPFYSGILLGLLWITAVSLFIFSGFKKVRLFKLYACFAIYSLPFTLWWYFIRFFTNSDGLDIYRQNEEISIGLIVTIFLSLLVPSLCIAALWVLSKEQKAKLTAIQYGDHTEYQFTPAHAGLRIANRFIDVLVILYFFYFRLVQGRLLTSQPFSNDYLSLVAIELTLFIVYYLLLEGIFNTTAGKCITNTVIVNENGNRPGFVQILGRTFARLIPFEALSFLGSTARGWHDSLSGTYVVPAANGENTTDEITLDAELNAQQ
jgi:uncharacterized RDD family membrane protein YckC